MVIWQSFNLLLLFFRSYIGSFLFSCPVLEEYSKFYFWHCICDSILQFISEKVLIFSNFFYFTLCLRSTDVRETIVNWKFLKLKILYKHHIFCSFFQGRLNFKIDSIACICQKTSKMFHSLNNERFKLQQCLQISNLYIGKCSLANNAQITVKFQIFTRF